MAAEIFGKLKAMERLASPPSSLIWLWLLVAFGEPLVTFLTATGKGAVADEIISLSKAASLLNTSVDIVRSQLQLV